MATFIIDVPEVHISRRRVEADTIEEAFEQAASAGTEIDLFYHETVEPDDQAWTGHLEGNEDDRRRYDGQDVTKSEQPTSLLS